MKLIDTSVVIDIDRGDIEEKVAKLDDEGRHAISVVTLTELRLGVNLQSDPGTDHRTESIEALERLCARFDLVDVSRSVAITAAEIIAHHRDKGKPPERPPRFVHRGDRIHGTVAGSDRKR